MKRKILIFICSIATILIIARVFGVLSYYNVPSTSNEPNLKTGSRFIGSNLIFPRHMDFAYFKFSDSLDGWTLIKRLIAKPGDKLKCENGNFFVNDKAVDELIDLRYAYVVNKDLGYKLIEEFKSDESFQTAPKNADSLIVYLDKDYVAKSNLNLKRYIELNNNYKVSTDISSKTFSWDANNFGPLIMPEDKYFFLGDNRDNSLDSRYRGFVDEENIMGTLLFQF